MAEFCTKCAHNLFGAEIPPDIDVAKEFKELESGMSSSGFMCEGCKLIIIGNVEGVLKVIRLTKEPGLNEWEEY
jgi:hypothetical protein